jgi:hypothetical protein
MFNAWDLFCLITTGEGRQPGPRGTQTGLIFPEPGDEAAHNEFNAAVGLILGTMRPRFFSTAM